MTFLLVQRNSSPLFDEEELQSEAVQRVWQYLQLFNEDPRLIQEFNFDAKSTREDSPGECLDTLIRSVPSCSVQQLPCYKSMISERRKHSKLPLTTYLLSVSLKLRKAGRKLAEKTYLQLITIYVLTPSFKSGLF